jgi:hypothetical protein
MLVGNHKLHIKSLTADSEKDLTYDIRMVIISLTKYEFVCLSKIKRAPISIAVTAAF